MLTSYRIVATVPLSALFILFDFVVWNPEHPETKRNLMFLDVASGYFSRLDLAWDGLLSTSVVGEFARLARSYVQEVQSRQDGGRGFASNEGHDAPQNLTEGGQVQSQTLEYGMVRRCANSNTIGRADADESRAKREHWIL